VFCVLLWKPIVTIREAQVIVGVISCTLGSGIVFGFAALKPVLVDRHAYRDLCTKQELDQHVLICYKQDLKYDNFTLQILSKLLTSFLDSILRSMLHL
jgi:hypothetical protein